MFKIKKVSVALIVVAVMDILLGVKHGFDILTSVALLVTVAAICVSMFGKDE